MLNVDGELHAGNAVCLLAYYDVFGNGRHILYNIIFIVFIFYITVHSNYRLNRRQESTSRTAVGSVSRLV